MPISKKRTGRESLGNIEKRYEHKSVAGSIKPKGERGVGPIRVKLKTKGTCLAVLRVGTFVTKTIERYFYKPKNELKNVLKSFWFGTVAKAFFL